MQNYILIIKLGNKFMLKALIEKLNLSYDDFEITDTESIIKNIKFLVSIFMHVH